MDDAEELRDGDREADGETVPRGLPDGDVLTLMDGDRLVDSEFVCDGVTDTVSVAVVVKHIVDVVDVVPDIDFTPLCELDTLSVFATEADPDEQPETEADDEWEGVCVCDLEITGELVDVLL